MAYTNIVFAKLEKRLFNDHRWYMMSEEAQLNFIRFILFAAETYNKIPKNLQAIKLAFKTNQSLSDIENTVKEIKSNFPKFKENKHFYYFDDFEQKTNYIPKEKTREKLGKSQAIAQDAIDKEKEKEEDKEKEKRKKRKREEVQHVHSIFSYFCEKTKQTLKLTPERKAIINVCFNKGRTVDQMKTAIDNFSKDDWVERPKYNDLVYCLGVRKGVDNFERWVNQAKPQNKGDIEYKRTQEYLASLQRKEGR